MVLDIPFRGCCGRSTLWPARPTRVGRLLFAVGVHTRARAPTRLLLRTLVLPPTAYMANYTDITFTLRLTRGPILGDTR